MIGPVIGLAAQAAIASAPVPSQAEGPVPSSSTPPAASLRTGTVEAPINPYANALFDRDPQLKAWALRLFDENEDGWLTLYEAQPALAAFKTIADANRDGRVTPYEYARAKEFVAARWAVPGDPARGAID